MASSVPPQLFYLDMTQFSNGFLSESVLFTTRCWISLSFEVRAASRRRYLPTGSSVLDLRHATLM
jgi:hypothetical protein